MKKKVITFFLFLVVVSLVTVLSVEIWKEAKPVLEQIFSGQINREDIFSPKEIETEEYIIIAPNLISDQKNDQPEVEVVETTKKDKSIDEKENTKTFSSAEENQEVVEEVKIEKTVTTPPPLVVENKDSSTNENALSNDGIIIFTNAEREKEGLNTLKQNNLLMQAAQAKFTHMFDEQYFEHVAPTNGEDVSYWVDEVAYKYITVGENLALGDFEDNEDMVVAWMESPGHRANILKEGYEEIGVAVGYGSFLGDEVWLGVQIFATPLSACPAINETLKVQIDIYDALIKETEITLNSMQLILSETKPETQVEYEEYNSFVAQYNELVVDYNSIVENLKFTVNIYNNQVNSFNSCIAAK